ncbi:MAG: transposase, partial [Polyangiaceae bacterium]|nr:transposase [Polyangiaceae bacterium]
MNHGRIERIFRTFKDTIRSCYWLIRSAEHLDRVCQDFKCFYNLHRPHQANGGRTPNEVYLGRPAGRGHLAAAISDGSPSLRDACTGGTSRSYRRRRGCTVRRPIAPWYIVGSSRFALGQTGILRSRPSSFARSARAPGGALDPCVGTTARERCCDFCRYTAFCFSLLRVETALGQRAGTVYCTHCARYSLPTSRIAPSSDAHARSARFAVSSLSIVENSSRNRRNSSSPLRCCSHSLGSASLSCSLGRRCMALRTRSIEPCEKLA